MAITLRTSTHAQATTKGSPLTYAEYDGNITALIDNDTSITAALAASGGSALVGYTPSGTGATTSTVQTELRRIVYVDHFGAAGDNSTDDSTAINLALAHIRTNVGTSLFPDGSTVTLKFTSGKTYKITDSVNATGIVAVNFIVDFSGAAINACTASKPALDFLGSRWFTLIDLVLWGDQTNKPTYGIQTGRISSSSMGEFNLIRPTIDGYFSVACFYNFAGETAYYEHPRFYNRDNTAGSYCAIFDAMNDYNITSAFITQTSPQGTARSFNQQTIIHADFRKKVSGRVMRLVGNLYQFRMYSGYAVSVDDVAFDTYKSTDLRNIYFDVHFETTGLTKCVEFDTTNASATVNISGLTFIDHNHQASSCIFDTTGNTRSLNIDGVRLTVGTATDAAAVIFGTTWGSSSGVLLDGVIEWVSSRNLDLSNFRFDGDIYSRSGVTVTHQIGTYALNLRGSSSANRIKEIKGRIRVTGTQDVATNENYVDIVGAATGGTPAITAGGSDTDINLTLQGQGAGYVRPASDLRMAAKRLSLAQGVSVTAANNLTLGGGGNRFRTSGSTQINLLDSTDWQGGSTVTLHIGAAVTIKHNQAASNAFKPILLAGGADFSAGIDDQLTLQYDSTDSAWYELSRTVI